MASRTIPIGPGVLCLAACLAPLGAAQAAVVISSAQTQNMSCSAGVCAPTASDATMNVTDLENLLVAGNIEVTTSGSGAQADDIVVNAPLAWTNTNTLGLDARSSITIDKTVSIEGGGGLWLTTNDGGSGGALSFGHKGHAVFQSLSGQLTINGSSYVLVNSVQSLAGAIATNPGGAFALANNYDAKRDGTYRAAPIQTGFSGALEGLGNAISQLSINGAGNIGLFVGEDGTVENLNLLDIDFVVQKGSFSGGLAGIAGKVSRVRVTGTIRGEGRNSIGGLVGADGILTDCSSSVQITANEESSLGGLVSFGDDITESFSTAPISAAGDSSEVGGLVAVNLGQIQNSYSLGTVAGGAHSKVGGLAGSNGDSKNDPGSIQTSYSTGAVSGGKHSRVGGFAGVAYRSRNGFIQHSYWDTTTSGTDRGTGKGSEQGITGETTQQLQSGLPAGFDPSVWAQDRKINNGLPYLINNPPQ